MLMHYCVHNACCKITIFFDPTLREVRMCTGALTNKSVRYKNAVHTEENFIIINYINIFLCIQSSSTHSIIPTPRLYSLPLVFTHFVLKQNYVNTM